ncbi:MAG: DUF4129 domain-containing protein, partial [Deltaproteobacteria bacterium]|nr:DUF4129 domain-containing protein [Deltaproteobacteria bacterium]
MLKPKRYQVLFILGCAALAVILMSASLSTLELGPGHRVIFKGGEAEEDETGPPNSFLMTVLKATFCLAGIMIAPIFLFSLRSRNPKRRKPRLLWTGLAILILVYTVPQVIYRLQDFLKRILMARNMNRSYLNPEEYIPNPPDWLVLMVSMCLSALILGAAVYIWRYLPRRAGPLELVAREAQKTLESLRAGADLREGVIHCYYEMIRMLGERRGLKRHQAMTTREFERYLEKEGLPEAYIGRLTRLFEMVRYGAKRLGEPEEQEAIDCLTAIVRASEGSL